MESKLSKEEVLHVARLARINLSDEDIEKYRIQLKQLMLGIEKIKDIKNYDEELLITPVNHETLMREDVVGKMVPTKEIMKNVPKMSNDFVEVPVMINE